jgi:hypothetical protein
MDVGRWESEWSGVERWERSWATLVQRRGKMSWTVTFRGAAQPVILMVVIAASTLEIFYGPSRGLNVVGAIILALSLFSVRKHYRVVYGTIEVVFSTFILTYNWRQGRGAFSSDFNSDFDIWVWQIIFIQRLSRRSTYSSEEWTTLLRVRRKAKRLIRP